MKKNLVVMVVLGVFVLGCLSVSLYAGPRMRANIPFAFYAGKDLLPAGEYWFELRDTGAGSATGASVILRSQNGSVNQFLPIAFAGCVDRGDSHNVVFNKYGATYFLCTLNEGGYRVCLPRTRAQKELAVAFKGSSRNEVETTVEIAGLPE